MKNYIKHFKEIDINDVPVVGGKNASLGEMFQKLTYRGVQVPDGFATTAEAYWHFLEEAQIKAEIFAQLAKLDTVEFTNLREIGSSIRNTVLEAQLPSVLIQAIGQGYDALSKKNKGDLSLAVRSSCLLYTSDAADDLLCVDLG